jgi:hypothetical protein
MPAFLTVCETDLLTGIQYHAVMSRLEDDHRNGNGTTLSYAGEL